MKLIKSILTGILAGWLTVTSPSFAEEPIQPIKQEQAGQTLEEETYKSPIALDFRADYLSKYVFRGVAYSNKPVIQHTLCASYGDLTAIGFANYDTQTDRFNETDITLDFTKALNNYLTLSSGYTILTFPNTEEKETQEVYAGITLERMLNPSLLLVHDFKEGKGIYGEFSIGHDFDFGKLGISASAALGYNDHYFREKSGLSHLELGLATPISLGKNITFTPMINHSESLNRDFESELYGRISLDFNF